MTDPIRHDLATAMAMAIEAATNRTIVRMVGVRGGDTATAFRVDLDDGERVFAKTHGSPPPLFFTTEATGLSWLAEPDVVPVPAVIAVSDGGGAGVGDGVGGPAFLALEWIEGGRPTAASDAQFGAALAALHDVGAPCFGREDRRTTGSLGLPNEPAQRWSTLVGSCRFLPLARLARDRRALPEPTIARLERLAGSLGRFDDGEPPSRLHGDLWAGNRINDTAGRSWLIDPACHGGHREFDLAMMRLFGGFSADCFRAYEEHHPLADGWRDRVQLHQIAPLVVHAIKFGGGYVASAASAINRF